eukprot:jgi/Botrbrau1/23606/Bobra.55_2s0003.1
MSYTSMCLHKFLNWWNGFKTKCFGYPCFINFWRVLGYTVERSGQSRLWTSCYVWIYKSAFLEDDNDRLALLIVMYRIVRKG